jgi:predicted nucleic acid-binding protein
MIVVSDTSVVTSLIQIGRLVLLQKLHGNPFL